ncbi:MAG: hypothetical protein IJ569_01495 [Prevotella sp.]|nr:hypothetical protein [Prevotella sp.]
MKWLWLWLMLLCVLLGACSSVDCPVQNVVSVQYVICDSTGTERSLARDSLSILSQRNNGTDTVLLNRLVGKSSFSLPISYSHPEDILLFVFANSSRRLVDTVWIKKEDIPHFESVDCNAAFFHELTDVRYTQHAIDSLVLKNRSVNYDVSTIHFHLYPKSGN